MELFIEQIQLPMTYPLPGNLPLFITFNPEKRLLKKQYICLGSLLIGYI